MSRANYIDYDSFGEDINIYNLYRGRVERALRGKRGQKALSDILEALDAMPEKKLVAHSFKSECGLCTLGALAKHRSVDLADFDAKLNTHDPYLGNTDHQVLGTRLDIARSMVAEIMYENDDGAFKLETDEDRWVRMRSWVESNLIGK